MRQKVFVMPLDAIAGTDRPVVGAKAVGLACLKRFGLPVPDAFCIEAEAYRMHVNNASAKETISEALLLIDKAKSSDIAKHLNMIRRAIVDSPMDGTLAAEIESHYRDLSASRLAVRSSATAEDLPGHSFAGLYDTYLDIKNLEACLTAIKKCWASLWTERAYSYRQKNGFDHLKVNMAVIVQCHIPADASGVLFTADPVTGNNKHIVIEACLGLGDALVSGKATPDRVVLEKKGFTALSHSTSAPCISDKTARTLAKLAIKAESEFGCPQDIEWAVSQNEIFILQSRPITTTLKPKSWEDRQVWTNANLGEVVPDVMTPITASLIQRMVHPLLGSIWRILGVSLGDNPIADLVAGRLYWSVNTGIGIVKHLPHWQNIDFDMTMGGQQGEMFELGKIDLAKIDVPDLGGRLMKVILRLPVSIYDIFTHRYSKAHQVVENVKRKAEVLQKMNISEMSDEELVHRLPVAIDETFGTLDLLYVVTSLPAIVILYFVSARWLNDEKGILASRLLAGLTGMDHAEAGLELWALALKAREFGAVEKLIRSPAPWRDVRKKLEGVKGGDVFLKAWDDFLARHGHHCRGELELFNPRWSENPDYILELVRNYLSSADGTNPVYKHAKLSEERQQLARECSAKIRNPVKRRIFNHFLRKAWLASVLRENSKSYVVRCVAVLRKMLLELGNRWMKKGVLDKTENIFFLRFEELESVLKQTNGFDISGTIAGRRAEYEKWRSVTPPSIIIGKFDPDKYRPRQDTDIDAELLKGVAASHGVVTGKARVILKSDENEQVKAGEILVAPFTDPGWTPYFIPAAGVVMDMGGLLSHGSVIAREYGIPAVVNVGNATKIIKTGQEIELDGDRGVVRILK
jgi:phosphoenolpyruvate synthase/pyruvate phosphate dikinase